MGILGRISGIFGIHRPALADLRRRRHAPRAGSPSQILALIAGFSVGLWVAAPPAPAAPSDPAAGPAASSALDLATLMGSLADLKGLVANFDEEKRITLLREPLRSSGRIYFIAPDRLARVATTPTPSRVFVDADRLGFVGGGDAGEIALDEQPLAGLFVDSFRMILGGDLDGLRKLYEIEFEAGTDADMQTATSWVARLTPSGAPLDRIVSKIVLSGDGRAVARFSLTERNGDVTDMRFSNLELDVVPPSAQLETLFELAPRETP